MKWNCLLSQIYNKGDDIQSYAASLLTKDAELCDEKTQPN